MLAFGLPRIGFAGQPGRGTLALWLAAVSGCGAADAVYVMPVEALEVDVAPAVNTCPTFAFYFVLPRNIRPGEAAALLVQGTDLDSDDAELSYAWSAASGAFSAPSLPATEYRCADSGPQLLNVTTSDAEGCEALLTLEVDCADH